MIIAHMTVFSPCRVHGAWGDQHQAHPPSKLQAVQRVAPSYCSSRCCTPLTELVLCHPFVQTFVTYGEEPNVRAELQQLKSTM